MKYMSCDKFTKIVDFLGISTCRVTSFECLRHIHLSLQHDTINPSMVSNSCALSYFEQSLNWYFSIHSLGRYIKMSFGTSISLLLITVKMVHACLASKFLVQLSNSECGGLETAYKDSLQMFQHSDRMFEQILQISVKISFGT